MKVHITLLPLVFYLGFLCCHFIAISPRRWWRMLMGKYGHF